MRGNAWTLLPVMTLTLALIGPTPVTAGQLSAQPRSAHAQPAQAQPDGPSQPGQAPEPTPTERARATGERMEVTEATTPTERVFANPDGSFTLEQHPVAVRARKGDGWIPVDTTLRFTPDGTVAPKAAATPVVFSGGGDGQPLVRLVSQGGWITLSWPRRLPRPELRGDTAVYREVFPGIDLTMRALPQGYSQVFVVKRRQAGEHPGFRRLSFALDVTGASMRQRPDSSLVARDAAGSAVFQAPPPQMWDSARDADGRQSVAGLELSRNQLVLIPDQKLLRDSRTRYPVFVDPSFSTGKSAWTKVFSGKSSMSYWNGANDDSLAKVGYCGWYGCNGIGTARSYFQFGVSKLFGAQILDAEFNVYARYSPSCSARKVSLYRTGRISSSTTWSNQPSIGSRLHTRNFAYGYSSSCSPRWVGFNAYGAVKHSVDNGVSTSTVMLRAADESDKYAWKKFRVDVSLVVTYNRYPNTPTKLSAEKLPCASYPDQQHIYTARPTLRATASDPDGDTVAVRFVWYIRGGELRGDATTLKKSSGSEFAVRIPSGHFTDGETISYRARTYDGRVWSDWTAWGCHITVDQTPPANQPAVSSADYPENEIGGAVGQTGTFAFGANCPSGDTACVEDVKGYLYDLHDQPQTFVVADSSGAAEVLITPPEDGPKSLWVRSVDRANNLGPMRRYDFFVGRGTPPVGLWRVDGLNQTDVPDSSDNAHHGVVTGGDRGSAWWWTRGRHDDALRLVQEPAHVTTGGPVLNTAGTFSVSAWARLDAIGGYPTAVSQDGDRVAGFRLRANPNGAWSFTMYTRDVDGGGSVTSAASAAPAQVGRWTHLVGVRDTGAEQLRLYVDGRLAATASYSASWAASGPFTIGRTKWNGEPGSYWPGSVDEVRAYDRALSVEEIADLAGTPTAAEGYWPLDETSGGSARDASGNFRYAERHGGAEWIDAAAVGSGGVLLDGSTGWLGTGGTAVRTDGSFTVSAYVSLDETNDAWQTLVSQDRSLSSAFALQYNPHTGKWRFVVVPADVAKPQGVVVESTQDAVAFEWVQLTGVYDGAAGELRLYVNGALDGSAPIPPGTTMTHEEGEFVVGRGRWNDGPVAYLAGVIDDVRLHTGVRTDDQIRADFLNPPVARKTPYSGQFNRWVGSGTGHATTPGWIPRGFHFEAPLGMPAPEGAPDTRMLYSCLDGIDEFTSTFSDCEGRHVLGELGRVYVTKPDHEPTEPLYRCRVTGGSDHFISGFADCEGQTTEGLLGYSRAYRYLISYRQADGLPGRLASAHGYQIPATYHPTGRFGIAAGWGHQGTVGLMVCRDGEDYFSSTDGECEGKTPVHATAALWAEPPPDHPSVALHRCRDATSGERFNSTDPDCEGQTVELRLGYLITTL